MFIMFSHRNLGISTLWNFPRRAHWCFCQKVELSFFLFCFFFFLQHATLFQRDSLKFQVPRRVSGYWQCYGKKFHALFCRDFRLKSTVQRAVLTGQWEHDVRSWKSGWSNKATSLKVCQMPKWCTMICSTHRQDFKTLDSYLSSSYVIFGRNY